MSDDAEKPVKPAKHGPDCDEWTDAHLMALARDTRTWITHDHEGNVIGDWTDTRAHLLALYSIAKWGTWFPPNAPYNPNPPVCMEIGVRHGITTMALLTAMREVSGRLISLEINADFASVAQERVQEAKLSQWWELHVVDCNEFAKTFDTQLDMLWIDGDHSEEQARRDVENYGSKVKRGGYVLMHDTFNPIEVGVPIVVQEMRQTGRYELVSLDYSYGLTIAKVL